MRMLLTVAMATTILSHAAVAAQPIDCTPPIATAQKSLDKITGDLQGMDKMMAKHEMSEIDGLVDQAKKLLKEAQADCGKTNSPYDQAHGIARADAANGYATAADILHFHYMQAMGSSGKMPMRPSAGAMKGGETGTMSNMNGMSSKK
jgi:hypothetical protein